MKEINIAIIKDVRKSLICKPFVNEPASITIHVLIIRLKIPKVIMLTGKVSINRIGLIIKLTSHNTNPAKITVARESTLTVLNIMEAK